MAKMLPRVAAHLILLLALTPTSVVHASVRVLVGPTPIPAGDARAAGDITVLNEHLAFAIAVKSPVPYGVPRGAIIDVAPVKDGKIGRDRVVFADFIPNNWSAWPNTYQHVDIVERGPLQAVIRSVRDWGSVTISTLYTLKSNSDQVEIRTTMMNGGQSSLPDLLSGLTLWPNSGFVLRVPGLADTEQGNATGALSDRVVAYDEGWAVTLHAPYLDHIAHGSLDLYRLHTLPPGGTSQFDGWLQVGSSADLAPVVRAEIERRHLPAGRVHGVVQGRDGGGIDQALVVVEKQDKPYAWTVADHGRYELRLAAGDYRLYATAKNHSQSEKTALAVEPGADPVRDFHDLASPGRIHWQVRDSRNGGPLDARLDVTQGQKPVAGFLGRNRFFTELQPKGQLDTEIAPGHYVFTVSSGGGFLSRSGRIELDVEPGKIAMADVTLTPRFDPPARGWYSADLHHHADQAEAVTPPADLARSQLAAGLNILFVSDHDSTVNHARLQEIADSRGMAFLAGIELSPSWGHFNAYPLQHGLQLRIDTGTATIDQIFQEARRQGASVVQANHPFISYGYFASLKAGTVPGGFNPGFELLEINAQAPQDDEKVLHALWDFWSAGHRYYLSAGTDTHDVWNDDSGQIRAFAHVDGKVSAEGFAEALRAGHAYVTRGPLIFPDVMFGAERRLRPGEPFTLGFDLGSVRGLKSIELIAQGAVIGAKTFPGGPQQQHVSFPLTTSHASWYAVVVEDTQGRKAYSDPIWVDVVGGIGPKPL